MKITNKHNLPPQVIDAMPVPGRPALNAIRTTRLIDSPQISRLQMEHWDEIEIDASDMLKALMGTTFHALMEKHAGPAYLTEPDLFTFIPTMSDKGDICITGKPDSYDPMTHTLTDWKTTSVWGVVLGKDLTSWERQLNVYGFLLRQLDRNPQKLQVWAYFPDWSANERMRYDNYPDIQMQRFDIRLWDDVDTAAYISERIQAHIFGPSICTDDERWVRPAKFAVKKPGRKSALSLHDTRQDAENWISQAVDRGDTKSGTLSIEERKGEAVRCERFCSVANFCPQWQSEKKSQEEK